MAILKSAFGETSKSAVYSDNHTYAGQVSGFSTYGVYKSRSYDNVFPNISKIADAFMVIRPYAVDDNGKPVREARAVDKLYHPNQQMSSVDFREALAVMSLVHRKVYLLAWRKEGKQVLPGGNITPDNIAGYTFLEGVSEIKAGSEKYYVFGSTRYDKHEIIEIYAGVDPYDLSRGYSPTVAAHQWTTLEDYIAAYESGFFENGAIPSGQFIITAPTVAEFNDQVDKMQEKHRGAGKNNNIAYVHRPTDNSGKPLDAQIEWIPFAQTNKQLPLKDLFDQVNKKLDAAYGVPDEIKGYLQNSNYASVSVAEKVFIAYVVKPFALKIWTRFTHELNRITGGLGYSITFDLDVPGLADEDKVKTETKKVESEIILSMTAAGYSLESIVNAFKFTNAYKLLKKDDSKPVIDNDKPDVDNGDEVEGSPDSNDINKSIHPVGCSCGHHHNLEKQTGTGQLPSEIEKVSVVARNFMEKQINRVIADKTKAIEDPSESDKDEFAEMMLVALTLLMLASANNDHADGLAYLSTLGVDVSDVPAYSMSEAFKSDYLKSLGEVAQSYADETAQSIRSVLEQADIESWSKPELADKLRGIMQTDEWRVQRLAISETHRSAGMASLDSMKEIEKATGKKLTKKWNITPGETCDDCLAMDGKTLPLTGKFLDVGESLTRDDGTIFENKWLPIESAHMHPSCKCYLTYEVL